MSSCIFYCSDSLTQNQKIVWLDEITLIDKRNPKNTCTVTYGTFLGFNFPRIVTPERANRLVQKMKPEKVSELKKQVEVFEMFDNIFSLNKKGGTQNDLYRSQA